MGKLEFDWVCFCFLGPVYPLFDWMASSFPIISQMKQTQCLSNFPYLTNEFLWSWQYLKNLQHMQYFIFSKFNSAFWQCHFFGMFSCRIWSVKSMSCNPVCKNKVLFLKLISKWLQIKKWTETSIDVWNYFEFLICLMNFTQLVIRVDKSDPSSSSSSSSFVEKQNLNFQVNDKWKKIS